MISLIKLTKQDIFSSCNFGAVCVNSNGKCSAEFSQTWRSYLSYGSWTKTIKLRWL